MTHSHQKWCTAIIAAAALLLHTIAFGQNKKPHVGYKSASYSISSAQIAMRNWLIAGPMAIAYSPGTPPDQALQQRSFKDTLNITSLAGQNNLINAVIVNGKTYPWEEFKATADIIDLDTKFNRIDFASAYALAEIKSENEADVLLGVGSDDAVRVWINGKLVHDNWIPRGLTVDEDIVPVHLKKGSNQILLKVQDIQSDWGFSVRVLAGEKLNEQLVSTAVLGDLDKVKMLLDRGGEVNGKNKVGITALMASKLNGREEVTNELIRRGAKDLPMPAPEKLIDALYSDLNQGANPGIAVLVAKDGKVQYKNAFGYTDINKKIRITPEGKFKIGSITKQFTAAAVLKLQEDGKLSIQDKLSKYIPDFPRGEEVTIHHLLTHTSGIHSFTSKPDFISRVSSPISTATLINEIKRDPYDFNPGEAFLYNNSGYFIAGYIVEKVSGMSLDEYFKKTFFEPLGMNNTGIYLNDLKLENEIQGYSKENNAFKPAQRWNLDWAGGAGALYSTVDDLFKWNEAIFNGKVLKAESLKAALTSVVLNNGQTPPGGKYGYGWFIGEYRGQPHIQHGGGLDGFISQLSRYPKSNMAVVLLTNVSPPATSVDPNTIAKFYLWETLDKQESKVVKQGVSEDLSAYEGRYDFGNGQVMIITNDNNQLFAQLTGQNKFEIYPSGDARYFWKVVDAKIKFVKDDQGVVKYGDFEQNGNKLRVQKLQENKIVSIDKKLYNFYIGKYSLGQMVLDVTTDNDKIFVQATNQPKLELLPLSETEFTLKEVNAKVSFIRAGDAKASKLILDMAGNKNEAVRME